MVRLLAGRETFLVKVDWVDDWPIFNEGKNIAILTQGRDPRPEATEEAAEEAAGGERGIATWTADLSKTELELGWYQKSKSPFAPPPLSSLALPTD